MRKIGIIKSILNDELVLVETERSLHNGDRLVVFAEVSSDEIKLQTGLDKVIIPKGEIIVTAAQGNNLYLAATAIYQPLKRHVIDHPVFDAAGSATVGSTLAASLFGLKSREIVESVPKTNPVPVDRTQSLKIKFQKELTVGDAVAEKGIM